MVFRFVDKVVYEVTKVIETPQKTQRNPDQNFCQHDFEIGLVFQTIRHD